MLLGHPSIEFVCLFIQTDIITAMSHELLTNLDETYREYSLTLLMTWLDSWLDTTLTVYVTACDL